MTALTVRDLAMEAFADAIDMLSVIEIIEAGNAPVAVKAVNAAKTDGVVMCIYRALWSRLIVIVARAYSKSRPGDRHVQQAFEMLKDSAVRTEVEKLGNAAALGEAIALWLKCRGDHRLQAVLDFRDKQIAHWGTPNAQPVINDILAVSRATAMAIERLAQGAGAITVAMTLDTQMMVYRTRAKQFWGAQTAGI